MEIVINESGCKALSNDMISNLTEIQRLVSEIDSQNGTLRAALGDDYEAIAKTVRIMNSELSSAYVELKTIISDMNEYMSLVHEARVALD